MDLDDSAESRTPHDEFISEFARNSRQLYAYIRSLAPNRHDADDVYQSTSLVMWRKLETYQPGTSFLAWGRQIAFYEIKKLRESTGRCSLFSDDALHALDAAFRSQADDSPRRLEALAGCLEKLAPASRWLIDQRYFHDRSPADIGVDLLQSSSSVYRSLARTHVWLMTCIQHSLSGVGRGN